MTVFLVPSLPTAIPVAVIESISALGVMFALAGDPVAAVLGADERQYGNLTRKE